MYETVTFDGGVLSESIDGGRASASIELSATGIVARTSTNQTFSIRYRDVVLDMGGASGRMVFCRTADRSVTIFCEDHRFPATLELESGNEISEQLTTLRKSRRT
ncbi:MAG: peptidase M48, partial [Planctomycetes bacterium]|nr:peptidase M48 [Planctomycetota bacterium]